VDIVKTGKHKELPPADEDWYFVRAGEAFGTALLRLEHAAQREGVVLFSSYTA
jgi:ribosomal protein S19E (S16A)